MTKKNWLLGRYIYETALHDRRGFRPDQIGIDDIEIWAEIFNAIGEAAREGLKKELEKTRRLRH